MLSKLLLQFLIGVGVGIYGYLVPGYINLSVLQLALNKNKKAIRTTLIIISLIEIPYCFLCMSGMQWIMQQQILLLIIKWLLAAVLLFLAIYTVIDTRKEKDKIQVKNKEIDGKQIKRLLVFAIFNPFQLSAWIIWGGYFIEKTWFEWTKIPILIFSAGASIGVFIILWVYSYAGLTLITYFSNHRKQINYVVAGILFFLAVLQIVKNLT